MWPPGTLYLSVMVHRSSVEADYRCRSCSKRAAEMLLLGRTISAQEAAQHFGLYVNFIPRLSPIVDFHEYRGAFLC